MVLGSINGINGATANTNVGIGVTTPQARLDINASSTGAYTGFRLRDGSQQNGYVLTSDANGFATWAPAGGGGGGSAWNLTGNAGTDTATNFIGTTDNTDLLFKVNGISAGRLNNDNANTAFGINTPDYTNTVTNNTAVGSYTLNAITTGSYNTALGADAMYSNTEGNDNVAVGAGAMGINTLGSSNVAVGVSALSSNLSGDGNVGVGRSALSTNDSGIRNVAMVTKPCQILLQVWTTSASAPT
jgi:hypothetical protein